MFTYKYFVESKLFKNNFKYQFLMDTDVKFVSDTRK